jgi:hypothetical protein
MIRTIVMSPVNVATEHQKLFRDEWRYQVYHSQPEFQWACGVLEANKFPSRVPLGRLGHLVFLFGMAGYYVEFQPIPQKKGQ